MDRRIQEVLTLVEAHGSGRVTVCGLAKEVGLSRSRLEHLFKEQTGVTLSVCCRRIRLARAKCLLGDSRLRVKEVAAQCGYAFTSSLTRDFKICLGLTPSQYRRSALR